jgi:hypothetical protein
MASDYRDLINQHMALFAAPIEASTADLGEGITSATIADFDQDGRPDILVTGKVGASFLINANAVGCTFVERYNDTGEVTYISKPNMVGAAVGDVNNDGRQDIAFLYADMNNQVFFNRGFRCFGHAIAMEGNAGLPCAKSLEDGQQAGALGDLNGDGAQDLAMVGVGGEVWVLYRETQASMKNLASTLGLTVTLPKGQIGPALVTAYDGARCLGVRVVTNSAPAFFGKTDKGPLKLVWRTAAGEQTKSVNVMKAQGLELAGLE